MSIYKTNPILENEKFLLRLTENKDCNNLLKGYGDKNALPFLIGKTGYAYDGYWTIKS